MTDTAPPAAFSDTDDVDPLADDINPRTKRAYTMSAEDRKTVGQRLAEARRRKAAERGAKPGSRNLLTGKSTRSTRSPQAPRATSAAPKTSGSKSTPAHVLGAEKLAGWVTLGGGVLSASDPVRGNIIVMQGQRLAGILVDLAESDKRVRPMLARVGEFVGPASAWADAGVWAGSTLAALMLSTGRVPRGPVGAVVAAVGGSLLDAATMAAQADPTQAAILAERAARAQATQTPDQDQAPGA